MCFKNYEALIKKGPTPAPRSTTRILYHLKPKKNKSTFDKNYSKHKCEGSQKSLIENYHQKRDHIYIVWSIVFKFLMKRKVQLASKLEFILSKLNNKKRVILRHATTRNHSQPSKTTQNHPQVPTTIHNHLKPLQNTQKTQDFLQTVMLLPFRY